MEKVQKSGYLLKRGEINKAWKARYCKLDKSRLFYFKKQDSAKPAGFIPLEQAVIRKCREDMGEDNCFEIVTKTRVYYLVAKSEAELNEWMHALSQRTMLHKENELLEKAEEMIAQEAYRQCLEDEHKFLDAYKKRRKTPSTWTPRRLGSSSADVSTNIIQPRTSARLKSTPTVHC